MTLAARGEIGFWLGVAFFVAAFVLRSAYHQWRFGSTGMVGIRPGAGALEAVNGILLMVGMFGVGIGAGLQAWGDTEPVGGLDGDGAAVVGLVLAAAGFVGTIWAQIAMGRSWRVGVPDERTDLVTTGPFRWVRNPIFTSMIVFAAGVMLLAPNWVSIVSAIAVLLTLEVHVRAIEEPHLIRIHGGDYTGWAARTGRFLPGLGLIAAQ